MNASPRNKIADVAVWGRVPPPIGGMSVHLERLLPYLEDAGISTQMYSVGRRTPDHPGVRQVSESRFSWLLGLLFGPCESVHYVFSDKTSARFTASLLSFFGRAKVVLRIGGEPLATAVNSPNPIERALIFFSIKNVDAVIGVSEGICTLAKSIGAKRVIYAPGFIPPVINEESPPEEVELFISHKERPVLLASGEIGDSSEDDLYGAYFLLDFLERSPDISVVFYAYKITKNGDAESRLNQEIQKRGLGGRYLLHRNSQGFYRVMQKCDVFLRPTLSDGDSNAIREALFLGVPVIASDCVERPPGVETYSVGEPASLRNVLQHLLSELDVVQARVRSLPKANNAVPIIKLFQDLLGRQALPVFREEKEVSR